MLPWPASSAQVLFAPSTALARFPAASGGVLSPLALPSRALLFPILNSLFLITFTRKALPNYPDQQMAS